MLGSSYTWCNFKQCHTTQYFLIIANFDKSTVRLHYLRIFSMLANFHGDQRLIDMSLINCLNSNFCSLK